MDRDWRGRRYSAIFYIIFSIAFASPLNSIPSCIFPWTPISQKCMQLTWISLPVQGNIQLLSAVHVPPLVNFKFQNSYNYCYSANLENCNESIAATRTFLVNVRRKVSNATRPHENNFRIQNDFHIYQFSNSFRHFSPISGPQDWYS